MANDLQNTSLVTKFAMKEFSNSLQLAMKVDRQLDTSRVFNKVGATVNVRRPLYLAATSGAQITTGQISDLEEGTVPVILDQREKVVYPLSSTELTLNIEDTVSRYVKPAMNELAQKVETYLAGLYYAIPNIVGTPGSLPSSFLDVANAGAKLDELGVPDDGTRCAFYGPKESVALADSLKGVYPNEIAKSAIERAFIKDYGNFMIYKNQSLVTHTVGVSTGTPLINGNNQNTTYALAKNTWTQTLNTDGWTNSQTGILKKGDVFTIADVYAVNRGTRVSTQELASFTVMADADSGASTGPAVLTISPPIIISGPYATVNAAPVDGKGITVKTGTGGSSYRQNLAFHPNSITLAMAQLDLPSDGASSARENYKGISVRVVRQYDIKIDSTIIRFDILFGAKVQNPEWAVRTTS